MSNDYYDDTKNENTLTIFQEDNYYRIEYEEMRGVADLKGNVVIPLRNYQYFIDDFEYILVKEFDSEWEVYLLWEDSIKKIEYDDVCYKDYEFLVIKVRGKWEFYDLTYYEEEEVE